MILLTMMLIVSKTKPVTPPVYVPVCYQNPYKCQRRPNTFGPRK
jgi:hypothetical protein